jgi:hypothetical protein
MAWARPIRWKNMTDHAFVLPKQAAMNPPIVAAASKGRQNKKCEML